MRKSHLYGAFSSIFLALVSLVLLTAGVRGGICSVSVYATHPAGSGSLLAGIQHRAAWGDGQAFSRATCEFCRFAPPAVSVISNATYRAGSLPLSGSKYTPIPSGTMMDPAALIYLPLVLRSHAPGPVILYFRADVDIADPGDTIHLEWASLWATNAMVVHLLPTGQYGTSWTVDPTGTMEYTIPESWRNYEYFLLRVTDDEGLWAQAFLSIPLNCPDTWFFEPAPDECPAAPALYSAGAEQPFEHGLMLWVGEQDSIYVLSDNGFTRRWTVTTDYWEEGDPVDDPSLIPPPGLYQPVRGFGLVWRETPGVRDSLGWATALEQGYDTAFQRTSRWKYNDLYIRALDGGVWRLLPEGSGWEHIAPP